MTRALLGGFGLISLLSLLGACAGSKTSATPASPDRGPFEAYRACGSGPLLPGTLRVSSEDRLPPGGEASRVDGYRMDLEYLPLREKSGREFAEVRIEQFDPSTWARAREILKGQALALKDSRSVSRELAPPSRLDVPRDSLSGPDLDEGLYAVYKDSTRGSVLAFVAGKRGAYRILRDELAASGDTFARFFTGALGIRSVEWRAVPSLEFHGAERDSAAKPGAGEATGVYLFFSDASRRAVTAVLKPLEGEETAERARLRETFLQNLKACAGFFDPAARGP